MIGIFWVSWMRSLILSLSLSMDGSHSSHLTKLLPQRPVQLLVQWRSSSFGTERAVRATQTGIWRNTLLIFREVTA